MLMSCSSGDQSSVVRAITREAEKIFAQEEYYWSIN